MTHPIPKNWQQERLRDMFDFKNGVNAEKKAYGSGIPFINVMEVIKFPALHVENIPGRIAMSKDIIEKNLVLKGDVLFNRTSEIDDEIAFSSVYLDEDPVIFGGFVIRGRPKNEKLSDGFKKYCFRSNAFRSALIRAGQGAVRSNIGQKDLDKVTIIFPDKKEQNRIVAVLERWDKSIEGLERKIALKSAVKAEMAQRLLTGKVRLPKFTEKWQLQKMGDLFERITRITENSDSIKSYSISSKIGFETQEAKYSRVMSGDSLKRYTHLLKGEFAYNKGNSITYPNGCVYMFQMDEGLVPFVYICFRNKGKICSDFYKHYFLQSLLDRELKAHITSGVRGNGLLNISPKSFFSCKVLCPPFEEQKAIAAVLETAEKELQNLSKKLSNLKKQKDYLLNNLVTGRIRTPENMFIPKS